MGADWPGSTLLDWCDWVIQVPEPVTERIETEVMAAPISRADIRRSVSGTGLAGTATSAKLFRWKAVLLKIGLGRHYSQHVIILDTRSLDRGNRRSDLTRIERNLPEPAIQ
ncbi:hypothetical protein [Thalassorhabdomicrobium marinisediminis]